MSIRNLLYVFVILFCSSIFYGCSTDADVASKNLSVEAGNFRVERRIVFYNGITDSYVLTIQGLCQIDHGVMVSVTCKTGHDQYKKHYLRVSDNVTYFAEQLDSNNVSAYRYQVTFRPEAIIPDIELRTSE